MPVILVIIIVAAWIVILGPNLIRRRSNSGNGTTSISHFHRQLQILEHSAPPPIVSPAYRLRSVDGSAPSGTVNYADATAAPVLTVVGADRLPRPALAFLGATPDPDSGEGAPELPPAAYAPGGRADQGGTINRPAELHARQMARQRRRDTLSVLAVLFVASLLIGFVPGAQAAWYATLVFGLALGGYVALLVHLRRMAEERERKLHYLTPGGAPGRQATGRGQLPVSVSGRYAHPSSQAVAAR